MFQDLLHLRRNLLSLVRMVLLPTPTLRMLRRKELTLPILSAICFPMKLLLGILQMLRARMVLGTLNPRTQPSFQYSNGCQPESMVASATARKGFVPQLLTSAACS